jgi:ATP-dependent Lon protease
VIVPEANLQDLNEIPRELRRKITFVGVTHMDEVLEEALESQPRAWALRSARRPHPGSAKVPHAAT